MRRLGPGRTEKWNRLWLRTRAALVNWYRIGPKQSMPIQEPHDESFVPAMVVQPVGRRSDG